MRPCFAFSNLKGEANSPARLTVFDEIGFWGVQAKDFVSQLNSVEAKEIVVEINSPGGDMFAGVAMYNALRASGKEITTKSMGVAASAASIVFMAGDKRVMPKNTFLMVHNPWTFAAGNADEMRETADTLDKFGEQMRATYAARTGLSDEKLAEMLGKDTWLTADEALADGFATEVVEEVEAQAKFSLERAELPEHVAKVFAAAKAAVEPAVEPAADPAPQVEEPAAAFGEEVLAMAKAAGVEEHASHFALAFASVEDAKAAITEAREVKALCAAVGSADKAAAFIKESKSLADVRAALIEARAQEDETKHVDTTQSGSSQPTQSASQSAVKTADIWAKRNANRK